MHPDLRHVGTLPPLDAPHHMRATEWGPYREGVVQGSDAATGSVIDVGLDKVWFLCVLMCVYWCVLCVC